MNKEPTTITIDPDSELAQVLDGDTTSVVLKVRGVRYRVDREDIFAHYDPHAVVAGLEQSRGALTSVDREQLMSDLRAQRRQESSGRPV